MNLRSDFPIFQQRPELIYLDNAATTQKPRAVLAAMQSFYEKENANVNRGAHFLGNAATEAYDEARKTVARFINAEKPHEIIFTRNATEAVNLAARSFGEGLKEGDEILLSRLEHHSNLVPWLQLSQQKGVTLRYFEVSAEKGILFDPGLVSEKTRLVALSGMSNVLGTITDLKPIITAAHAAGAKALVDACQLIVHRPVDARALDADLLVFSGHKLYGPMGIGVLYGKEALLKAMPAFLGGGDMVHEVFEDHFTPADLPNKFEAGTPNAAGAVGLAAAMDYLEGIGRETIIALEEELTAHLLEKLAKLPFVRVIGPKSTEGRGSVVSFTLEGAHPHDISEGLSQKGICVRAGHHCCQVLMDKLGINATTRISLALYNTKEEIDKAVQALEEIYKYFNS